MYYCKIYGSTFYKRKVKNINQEEKEMEDLHLNHLLLKEG